MCSCPSTSTYRVWNSIVVKKRHKRSAAPPFDMRTFVREKHASMNNKKAIRISTPTQYLSQFFRSSSLSFLLFYLCNENNKREKEKNFRVFHYSYTAQLFSVRGQLSVLCPSSVHPPSVLCPSSVRTLSVLCPPSGPAEPLPVDPADSWMLLLNRDILPEFWWIIIHFSWPNKLLNAFTQ